ncbi:hypothetical protein Q1695_007009 [Nippostrongylus brasiliensis]|nr:hypothetical protein Q1695_007009 [Nippostrongylus brasiliensis]
MGRNIDEEYNRFIAHIRDCAQEAESPKTTRKRLSHETLELIRQRGVARTEGDYLRTSELAKLCREAIKEDLIEGRVAALVDATEAGKSIRNARRGLINYKTTMTALLRQEGALTSSRRAMEKVIHDFYSDLFDSHVHLPEYPIPNDGHWTRHPCGSPFRDSSRDFIDEELHSSRSRQDPTRTSEEPTASPHQHPGQALHTIPVGLQSTSNMEN